MRQIVVGFADVETAHRVTREAVGLAVLTGAALHVVTAIDEDTRTVVEVGSDSWEIGTVDAAERAIHEFMQGLPNRIDYTLSAIEGKPAEVLIEEAKRLDADLIVVGNVRMQGAGRVLGSVGSGVAHHAPCNVLIVKSK